MKKSLGEITQNATISIYGAGKTGKEIFNLIKIYRNDLKLLYFLDSFNSGKLNNINIYTIDEYERMETKPDSIIIASVFHDEIEQILKRKNIENFLVLDPSINSFDINESHELKHEDLIQTWADNLNTEADFWENSLAMANPKTDWNLNPDLELQDHYKKFLNEDDNIFILDMGSGPLTTVGKKWGNHKINLTAVDPLADEYNKIIDKLKLNPPVKTIKGGFENLETMFPNAMFNLINVENSLDHCANPLNEIKKLFKPLKKGCILFISSFINEGEYQHYHGLHKWNLCLENNDLMLWNPLFHQNISEHLKEIGETVFINHISEKRWFQIAFKKI